MNTLQVPNLPQPVSIPIASIVWIEGYENYTWVHYSAGRPLLVCRTLKWYETQLHLFIRVHKSSLINPDHLVHLNQKNPRLAEVVLSTGTRLAVSRRRVEAVVERVAHSV